MGGVPGCSGESSLLEGEQPLIEKLGLINMPSLGGEPEAGNTLEAMCCCFFLLVFDSGIHTHYTPSLTECLSLHFGSQSSTYEARKRESMTMSSGRCHKVGKSRCNILQW